MKTKTLLAAVICIVLALLASGTLAYFTQESEIVHNVITTGTIDVELIETGEDGRPFEDIDGAMPGGSYAKEVTVNNTGTADAYVRVKVDMSIELANGEEGDVLLLGLIGLDTTNWEYKDGYYYYKEALKPGETTPPLFTGVSISEQMDNPYQNCTISVDVSAQAVQVANNGDSATAALGWPASAIPMPG